MNITFDQIYDGNELMNNKFDNKLSTLFFNLTKKDKNIIFNHKGMKYIYFDDINDNKIDIIYDCNLELTKFMCLVGNKYAFSLIKGLFNIDAKIVDLKQLIEINKIKKKNKEINHKHKSLSNLAENDTKSKQDFKLTLKEKRNISCPNFNDIEIYNEEPVFIIITNEKIASIAEGLKCYFDYFNFKSKIQFSFNKKFEKKNEIYILLYIKYFTEQKNNIPENYIVYQLEQIRSNMFTKEYYKLLSLSKYIFDFSEANDFYYNQIRGQVFVNNFPLSLEYKIFVPEFDILFYGELNTRRTLILKHLKNFNFDINIVSDVFGEERDNLIKKCKIVLNLHFYNDACLETCRINEVLKYNKLVISEEPKDEDFRNRDLYNDCVQYFDIVKNDLSNISSLVTKIKYCLNNYDYIINNMDRNKIQNFCRDKLLKNINYVINKNL